MTNDLAAKLQKMSDGFMAEALGETFYKQSRRLMGFGAVAIDMLTAKLADQERVNKELAAENDSLRERGNRD